MVVWNKRPHSVATREALRSRPRRRPRPRILASGVMGRARNASRSDAGGSFGVLECCALSELHPASAGLGVLSGRVIV